MPEFNFTAPDGRTIKVTAPEGATQAEAFKVAQRKLASASQDTSAQNGPFPMPDQNPLSSTLSRAGSFVRGIPGALRQLPGAIAQAAQGPEGLPELPEFDAPAPTTRGTIKTAAGLMAAVEPEAQADILRANYPGVEIEQVGTEEQPYFIADYTDPQGEQHRGYINAPGLSGRDVTQIVGQGLAYTPAGRTSRAAGAISRSLRTGGKSFLTSLGLDKLADVAGSEQGTSLSRARSEGFLGAGLEVLSPTAARVFRAMRGKTRFFNDRTGQLTREGRDYARAAGLSEQDIEGMGEEARRTLGDYAEANIVPSTGGRVARVTEFGLPATRGQIGREGQQLVAEERMRAGAMGNVPQQQLREELGERQTEAVNQAAENIQTRVAPTSSLPATTEAAAAERTLSGVRGAAETLQGRIDDAYERVREAGGVRLSPQAAGTLPDVIIDGLKGFDVHPKLTPATHRATQLVGDLFDSIVGGDPRGFDTYRQLLSQQTRQGATRQDRAGATRVLKAFDNWVDDAFDRQMFSGDPEALKMLREAQSLRRQYGRQFEASSSRDTAGKIMDKIVNDAKSPEEVVNYIFGQSALGRNQSSARALKRLRDAVGPDSEAWSGIRETAWLRLTRNRRGDFLSGQQLKNAIGELKNRNKDLYNTLFNSDEQQLIKRFVDAVDVTQPPRQNPSGTEASLENAIRYTLRRFGQRESFTKGNVGRGTLLNFMARMKLPVLGRSLGGTPADRAMDIRPPAPGSPGFVATSLGINATQDEQRTQ